MKMLSVVVTVIILLQYTFISSEASWFGNGGCTRIAIGRALQEETNEIVTTTTCSKILDPNEYLARLDLSYLYSLEVSASGETNNSGTVSAQEIQLLLHRIERALATSVASTLHQCNSQQQPIYAVQISPDDGNVSNARRHIVLPYHSNSSGINASCPSASTFKTQEISFSNSSVLSQCLLVHGVTSVLLEESVARQNVSTIDSLVYTLIQATIENIHFLNQFVVTQPILQNVQLTFTKYEQSMGGNLILLPGVGSSDDHESMSETFKLAIISIVAVVGLLLTLLLLIILCRQRLNHESRNGSNAIVRHKNKVFSTKKRRRHDPFSFEALEDNVSTNDSDDPLSPVPSGWMIVTNSDVLASSNQEATQQNAYSTPRVATTAWSDLTSDSESIMSSLHLDRIDEEVGECSYEQEEHEGVKNDLGNCDENVEVSLSDRNWDDEIRSWPSRILPLSSSRNRSITDINVLYHDDFDSIMSRLGFIDPNCDTDLNNIEVSLDKENLHIANIIVDYDAEIGENRKNRGQSFTFSSDSGSTPTSYEEETFGPMENENAQRRNSIREHLFDDEDFQSIEMCVVWMDDDKGEPEAGYLSEKRPTFTKVSHTADQNDVSTGCESSMQEESLVSLSIESSAVSTGIPSTISPKVVPLESDITNSNDLLKCTLGTESTWSNVHTFTSSDAYHSDLEFDSNPSLTGSHSNDPGNGDSRTVIAYWARQVMIRLMSDSPKMLRCGTEMESSTNDTEFRY